MIDKELLKFKLDRDKNYNDIKLELNCIYANPRLYDFITEAQQKGFEVVLKKKENKND